MIDAKEIEERARGKWYGILTTIGIPESYLTGKHGPCIICNGRDRWRWDDKDGSGSFYCNQCQHRSGNGIALVQRFIGCSFPEALEIVQKIVGGCEVVKTQSNKMSAADIKKMLNTLWDKSTALTGSDPVSKYLHARKLVLRPDNVRYCHECFESDTRTERFAMIARIVDKNNAPLALHRTYLNSEQPKKADIKRPKKITPALGPLVGCVVRLFPIVDNEVIVCEGIETGIACKQLFDIPAWACLSSAILEGFDPPEEVRKVVICSDNDASFTGQKSAYVLANKLYNKDLIVEVRVPEEQGFDWNDVLIEMSK